MLMAVQTAEDATAPWLTVGLFVLDLLLRVGLSVRVIMRRQPVAISLAWLTVVLIVPFIGAFIYLLIGEVRLGDRRAKWLAQIHPPYVEWLEGLGKRRPVDWSEFGPACEPLARLAQATVSFPAVSGNELQLIEEAELAIDAMIEDVERAQRTCHLEFYIWTEGGRPQDLAEALIRAARRKVLCRVLLDGVGSREFLRSETAQRLREAGVRICEALPVGVFRMLFDRLDLRQHRKIVVIDGEIGYTGSMNMVDPRFFKIDADVGQWVDAMVRIRGPGVEGLAVTFIEDWELETGEGILELSTTGDVRTLPSVGASVVQIIPSGPLIAPLALQEILAMGIYGARREIVLTTPYFVPDEMLVSALKAAAYRGVKVTIVVPQLVDSVLVRLASQVHKDELVQAGVRIVSFRDGLLHTKSITIDREISFLGSLNLDPRSLRLNFEITAAIYDAPFTAGLRRLQEQYISRSNVLTLRELHSRSLPLRLTQNAARLLSPLL